jgi:hypothetical protein
MPPHNGPPSWISSSSSTSAGARSLHIYRVAPADWLVSEVGRGTEGRGPDVRRALIALYDGAPCPEWADSVADALGVAEAGSSGDEDPTSALR